MAPRQRWDTNGLVYLNNRYHDPILGHFISVDPLVGKTGQPYLYGDGNPTTLSDPSGLCAADDGSGSRESCVSKLKTSGPKPRSEPRTADVCDSQACRKRLDFSVPVVRSAGQIYVGAYISDDVAGGWTFPSHWDDREMFEDPGDCSLSRACMWIDFDTGEATIIVNYSCDDDGCYDAWDLGTDENTVTISGDGINEPFKVDVSLTNSARGVFGMVAPLPVDFAVEAFNSTDGGFVDITYAAFPSYEIDAQSTRYHSEEVAPALGVPWGLTIPRNLYFDWEWAPIGTLPPPPTSGTTL